MYWSEKWRCLAIEEKNQVINRKHGRGTYGKNGVCESAAWRTTRMSTGKKKNRLRIALALLEGPRR
jgi:hypothetical protein|tara:strand:- start:992 stop:1189 length:198 start_codon:yes stop_codon:yes gene_type:complete